MKDALPGAVECRIRARSICSAATSWPATCSAAWSIGSQHRADRSRRSATAFALMVGITLGLPAGYYGGRIDFVPVVPRQSRARLPGHPAVLPAGDAGNHATLSLRQLVQPATGIGAPIPRGLGVLPVPDHLLHARSSTPASRTGRSGSIVLLGAHAPDRRLGLYRPRLQRRPVRASSRSTPTSSTSSWRWCFASSARRVPHRARPHHGHQDARLCGGGADARREPWYIMLWEILPNARGPLIVDACLRIGYTTILLGTLGYFGLGLAPESPDWGTAIKDASRPAALLHPSRRCRRPFALMTLRAGPQPAGRRAARTIAEGLTVSSRRRRTRPHDRDR